MPNEENKGEVRKRGPLTEEQKQKRREARKASGGGGGQKVGAKGKKMKGVFVESVMTPIEDIFEYENNPKLHPPEQIEKIAMSIKEYRFDQPIVVDGEGVIIKGHGRFAASKLLGLKEVPVVWRRDMTENEIRAARIADNQTAESFWNIANLLAEFEALYGDEIDITLTGYDMDEVKTLYPGLLESDSDHAITNPDATRAIHKGSDGKIGRALPKTEKGVEDLVEWINSFDQVLVPFSGDREGLAALCWAIKNGVKTENLVVKDVLDFGQRLFHFHDSYLTYVSEALGVQIVKHEDDLLEEFLDKIKEDGFPTSARPWDTLVFQDRLLREAFTEDESNTVILLGSISNPEEDVVYRERGVFPDSDARYAAPFCEESDAARTEVIRSAEVKLNPIYQVTDGYFNPFSPFYSRPDYAFIKKYDLDLWIRWMIYFGRSQFCESFVEGGQFNDRALELLADSIEPREYGTYRKDAMELPEAPQPVREAIYAGDDYGWNRELDEEQLDPEKRLDKPRGRWWEEVGYSAAFKKMDEETKREKEERGDTPLDEWLPARVAEAKRKAAEEGLE